jgi:hypothetical protein
MRCENFSPKYNAVVKPFVDFWCHRLVKEFTSANRQEGEARSLSGHRDAVGCRAQGVLLLPSEEG